MIFFHFRLVQFSASRLCFPKILFFHVWRFSRGSIFQSTLWCQFWKNLRRYLAGHRRLFAKCWLSSDRMNSTIEICQNLVDLILSRVFRDSKSRVLVGPSVGRSVITLGYFFVYIYSVLSLTVVVLKCPKGQYVLRRRAGERFCPSLEGARMKQGKNETELD